MMSFLDLDSKEKLELMNSNLQRDAMIDFITSFINNSHSWKFQKKKHQRTKKRDQLFLLCLDNATNLL